MRVLEYRQMMGQSSERGSLNLLQPVLAGDYSLWRDVEFYLAERRMTVDRFRRRHQLDRSFMEALQAGGVPDTHPAAAKVRRIVAFGPDLRRRRKEVGLTMRAVEKKTGITPSRLSRAERLQAELTPSEKRQIDRLLAEFEKKQDDERRVDYRRQLAALLRTARSARGFTQEELAAALGCGRKAVMRWEKDGSVPEWRLRCLQSILPAFSPPPKQKGR